MKLAVFTSNQARHVSLVETLATIAREVVVVQECTTIFPGAVEDFFRKSPTMQDYFSRVMRAEKEVFGTPRFLPSNARSIAIKMGDVSKLELSALAPALDADAIVVFGASFIKGPLCEALVARNAINIHMGISPHYRGSSTNFWAMYDDRPQFVGATIHRLTAGLDSGPMLYHALPAPERVDPFVFGMRAVRAAHQSLARHLRERTLDQLDPVQQDRSKELRYTRNADFTDAVASEYLSRLPTAEQVERGARDRDLSNYLRPVVA